MNIEKKQLILELATAKISTQDFVKKFSWGNQSPVEYVRSSIERALQNRDATELEYSMIVGFHLKAFQVDMAPLLATLLLETWHHQHENIASVLQKLKVPSTAEALYTAAFSQHPYLAYDDAHALAVKCLWALYAINTNEAREKLLLLANSQNRKISSVAQELLQKQTGRP
jgi:hypothetical protein